MNQSTTYGEQRRTTRAPLATGNQRVWGPAHRWLTIGLMLTILGAAFEALAVATILPAVTRELGGIQLYGWAFSAFFLTNLIGVTVAGGEADRHGAAKPFLVGVALFVAGLVLGGVALNMHVLVAARALQGLGAGTIGSIAYVAIARGYPDALKAQMLAIVSSAWVVPGLIGPAISGAVADYAGWRWVFLGLTPVPVLAALLTLPALRRLGAGSGAPRDWSRIAAAFGLAAGAGLLLAGLGAQSLVAGLGLVGGGAALGLPSLARLLPPGTLRVRAGMPAAVLTSGLLNLAFFGVDAFVPLALTEVRGQAVTFAGLALTTATITWTAGSWLQARLASGGWRRELSSAGLVVLAIGCAATALVLQPAVPVVLGPVAWGIAGLGMGITYSTLSLIVLEHAGQGSEGAATAAIQLLNVLGSALGAGAGGAFVAYASRGETGVGSGIFWQTMLMLGVVALALLTAQRLPNRAQRRAEMGESGTSAAQRVEEQT